MLLQGLKVVEHATYIAAPGAGGLLADWGADVIKIEPPGGDPIRGFFASIGVESDANPVFELDNRGKRSVILDTATEPGREAVRRLVDTADVFITNVRPGGLMRAGLDAATLMARNPRLIHAHVTGYGLVGPDADRPGMDVAAFWARSGWASLTAPKGVEPFPIRTGVGDHVCSLSVLSGILAALVERGRTGKGREIDASLLRAAAYTLGSDLAIQMRFGRIGSTRSRHDAINPLANFFRCGDGRWVCLLPRQGKGDWEAICTALQRPDLVQDPRFAGARQRRQNAAALVDALDGAFAAQPLAAIADALDAQDLTWAPVQTPAEAVADPQLAATGGIVQVADGRGGTFAAPAGPVRFPGMAAAPARPAPAPGAHTREVLEAAGFSPGEIAALVPAPADG